MNERTVYVRALYEDAKFAELLDDLGRMKNSVELALKLTQEGSDQHDTVIGSFYLGVALFRQGDLDRANAYLEQSLLEFQSFSDPYWEANTYLWLSRIHFWMGNTKSIEFAMRGIKQARKAGEVLCLLNLLSNCAYMLYMYGQMDRARKLLGEVQDLLTQINFQLSPILLTFAQNTLAEIEWFDENRQKARTLLMDSQTRLRLVGEKLESSICIESLALLSMEEGNLEQAQLYFEESLSIAEESEFRGLMAKRLALLSTLFYIQGDIAKSKPLPS